LREISFRLVGEGTGKPLDIDEFDQHYLHLFLWDREDQAVAGAYRVGRTDQLIADHGPRGLYCSTLFEFEQPFLDHLTPGLEVGRSFVAPDYQRSLGGLLGLWKGLAAFVAKNPRYGKLFGPVSISNDYTPISQNLMVRFLREKKQEEALAEFVRPYHPFEVADYGDISLRLESLEQVSARVAETEPDGKSIPILLKQYLRLNATLLEFNVDPSFGNCLDALLLIDLHRTPDRVLGRYMGKAALRRFRQEAALK
jgi:putative hemolysin